MKEFLSSLAIVALIWLSLILYGNAFTYHPDTLKDYKVDTLGQAQ